MLPNPLHPAIVHFPVVLAFLLPISIAAALWAIGRGTQRARAWAIPLATAVALAASSWAAVETGEAEDERVERVVAAAPLHAHEEMAETFLAGAAGLAVIAAIGMFGGLIGKGARIVTGLGSLALIVAVAKVGHSGGELVYRYGAASAYTGDRTTASALPASRHTGSDRDDDDNDR